MAGKKKDEQKQTVDVTIPAPNFQILEVEIEGTAPLVMNNFSQKAREQMVEDQKKGSAAKKKKSSKPPKDFDALYEGAKHYAKEGWVGIPATAFRRAMVRACSTVGYVMTRAKMAFFIEADGFEADGGPLVKITKGEPHYCEHMVRNETGVVDIRPRAMWDEGWRANVRVRFDRDMFEPKDVVNVLARAGMQVGILEGRPFSKKSDGMGWGLFRIVSESEPKDFTV